MSDRLYLSEYKQQIADLYSDRASSYDRSDWHQQIACRLVEYAEISPGHQVLDIATGTGMAAIETAKLLDSEGRVIGVDISEGMLSQARQKVETLNLGNIEFQLADGESLNFSANSFDRIFCSSALIWMADVEAALRLWYKLLKPNGKLGFHGFANTSFVSGVVTKQVCQRYGVSLTYNEITGTAKKCHNLLASAGFKNIEVKTEQYGSYISLESAKQMWMSAAHPTPGQFPNPLSKLSAEKLKTLKAEFETELEKLASDRGIWNDITIFFSFGKK